MSELGCPTLLADVRLPVLVKAVCDALYVRRLMRVYKPFDICINVLVTSDDCSVQERMTRQMLIWGLKRHSSKHRWGEGGYTSFMFVV